jgi:TPR repeat protein
MKLTLLAALIAVGPALVAPAADPPPRADLEVSGEQALAPIPENDEDCDLCDGARLMKAGQHDRAMHVFQLLAARGDSDAMNNIGWMYQYGLGRPVDYAKALAWYRKSADLGAVSGQVNLAKMYEQGLGVKADPRMAARYYQAAARDHDLSSSAFDLAYAYQHGMGVPVDYAKAMTLFRQSADDDGEVAAMNQIGYLYQHGLGVKTNPQAAWCWYQLAAVNGHAASAAHLAEIEARHEQPAPGSQACEILNQPAG